MYFIIPFSGEMLSDINLQNNPPAWEQETPWVASMKQMETMVIFRLQLFLCSLTKPSQCTDFKSHKGKAVFFFVFWQQRCTICFWQYTVFSYTVNYIMSLITSIWKSSRHRYEQMNVSLCPWHFVFACFCCSSDECMQYVCMPEGFHQQCMKASFSMIH